MIIFLISINIDILHSLFLHSPVLQSEKVNGRENAHEDKNAKIISHENKLAYSTRNHMSRVVRKPAFWICENKDADQLRGNREADQRLCFRYTDSIIPLLSKSEISSFYSSSDAAQPGLCRTCFRKPRRPVSQNEAHVVSVRRGFLFLMVIRICCVILFWHFLGPPHI